MMSSIWLSVDMPWPFMATQDSQKMGIDFVDLESFKKNKKAVGRYQDLADLENLE